MRVTSKGQVTIPKDIRDKLGIAPGDEVGFRQKGDVVVLENLSAATRPDDPEGDLKAFFEELARIKRDGAFVPLGGSVDAHMEILRGYSEDADDPGFQHHP